MRLHLNADKDHTLISGRRELPLCCGGDPEPITGRKCYLFSINDRLAPAGKDPVDLLVVLVGVNERDAGAGGKPVDADLRAGQAERFVELRSVFIADGGVCVVCYTVFLLRIWQISLRCLKSTALFLRKQVRTFL